MKRCKICNIVLDDESLVVVSVKMKNKWNIFNGKITTCLKCFELVNRDFGMFVK